MANPPASYSTVQAGPPPERPNRHMSPSGRIPSYAHCFVAEGLAGFQRDRQGTFRTVINHPGGT